MAVVADTAGARGAAAKGATLIQLRAPELSTAELAALGRRLLAETTLPLVVSARLDLALALDAAGVHLPEHDLPVAAARRLLGDRLLGRSVHSIAAAEEAARQGADYVVFGPVFKTASHPGHQEVGLEALAELAAAAALPVLAIGGVGPENAGDCLAAGAAGWAAIGAFRERQQ